MHFSLNIHQNGTKTKGHAKINLKNLENKELNYFVAYL